MVVHFSRKEWILLDTFREAITWRCILETVIGVVASSLKHVGFK
jgi:hypothetical protein